MLSWTATTSWTTSCTSFFSKPYLSCEAFTPTIGNPLPAWLPLNRARKRSMRRKRKNTRAGPTMTSTGDCSYSVSVVMISQTWPPLPLCGDIKAAQPEDTDHAVIARVGVSVQEAPWGHRERWFLKMFPHSCADCQSQTCTHTWVNKAVGVSRQKMRDTTVDEAMKQWKPAMSAVFFSSGVGAMVCSMQQLRDACCFCESDRLTSSAHR